MSPVRPLCSQLRTWVNLVVARPLAAAEEALIRDTLTERLRHSFAFELVYLDEIPTLPSGKFEAFRSELADAER